MKKQIILLVALVSATFIFTATAQTKAPVIVKIEKAQKANAVNLRLANLEKEITQVAIVDVEGKSWFSTYLWGEVGYAKSLNLAGMPDGNYMLFVKNKRTQQLQAFQKVGKQIGFFQRLSTQKKAEGIVSPASFDFENKGTLVTHITHEGGQNIGVQLANLQEHPTTIRLVSTSGINVLEQTVDERNGYATKWNLMGMTPGSYFFYIESMDAVVVQLFNLTNEEIELKTLQRMNGDLPLEDVTVSSN